MKEVKYMVLVEGQPTPKHKHKHCPGAMVEAEQLAKVPANRGLEIYVVEVVKVLTPVHAWSGMMNGYNGEKEMLKARAA